MGDYIKDRAGSWKNSQIKYVTRSLHKKAETRDSQIVEEILMFFYNSSSGKKCQSNDFSCSKFKCSIFFGSKLGLDPINPTEIMQQSWDICKIHPRTNLEIKIYYLVVGSFFLPSPQIQISKHLSHHYISNNPMNRYRFYEPGARTQALICCLSYGRMRTVNPE